MSAGKGSRRAKEARAGVRGSRARTVPVEDVVSRGRPTGVLIPAASDNFRRQVPDVGHIIGKLRLSGEGVKDTRSVT